VEIARSSIHQMALDRFSRLGGTSKREVSGDQEKESRGGSSLEDGNQRVVGFANAAEKPRDEQERQP
jgi:hypothetical protein